MEVTVESIHMAQAMHVTHQRKPKNLVLPIGNDFYPMLNSSPHVLLASIISILHEIGLTCSIG
jgi:hypothetical protein